MATLISFSFAISTNLILFLLCIFYENGHALGRRLGEGSNFHSVHVSFIIPQAACSSSSATVPSGAGSLKVVNRHGPCHQTNQQAPNKHTFTQILTADISRATAIQARHANKLPSSEADLPASSGIPFDAGDYVVTVGLGTPKTDFTMIFDTGSDFTWTQCEPCSGSCFKQKGPIYNPANSSTFSSISCDSTQCLNLLTATGNFPGCSVSTCTYEITYGDGSLSAGLFGQETLTLTPTDVFDGFFFGCGQTNKGLFGEVAGLIGLGRDTLSIVSQTAQKYGQVFSYCLPTPSGSNGHLTFGSGTNPSNVQFTPFSSSQSDTFYFVDIESISVGGKVLDISVSVFQSVGTIIDSGTVITRLPATAYTALRDTFRQQTTQFKTAPPFLFLDTCYDLSKETKVDVPKISFVFNGNVEVDLDIIGTLVVANGTSQVCLAFAGNPDDTSIGIFGNIQQQKFDIVYDVAGGKLGFGAGGCS